MIILSLIVRILQYYNFIRRLKLLLPLNGPKSHIACPKHIRCGDATEVNLTCNEPDTGKIRSRVRLMSLSGYKKDNLHFIKSFSVEKTLTQLARIIKKYDICSHDSDRNHI